MNLNEHQLTSLTAQILASATETAIVRQDPKTSTRHVVMALCTDPAALASISAIIRFDPDLIHSNIELGIPPSQSQEPGDGRAYTEELTNALDSAADIAFAECGCEFMAPHHLLLGILRSGDQSVINTLAHYGITYDTLLSACKVTTANEIPANAS